VVIGRAEGNDRDRAWQEMVPQIATDVEGLAPDDLLGHGIALEQDGCPQRWAASQHAMGRMSGGSCGVLHHVYGDPCRRPITLHRLGLP
jgi:hypothetical protein